MLDYIKSRKQGVTPDKEKLETARRMLLNTPFICSGYSFLNWIAAATLVSAILIQLPELSPNFHERLFQVARSFMGIMISGLMTSVVMFFSLESLFRKTWPSFFPSGGLTKTDKVIRISLRKRMLITFFLSSIMPLYLMGVISYTTVKMMMQSNPESLANTLLYSLIFIFFVGVALILMLVRHFGNGLVGPVEEMARAMARVEHGDLDVNVGISNNNELGVLAESFNRMIDGLKDRYQLKQSLALAMEVQQNLLPVRPPETPGLQIWGKSLYCDETGGDYYDFFERSDQVGRSVVVAVGDVSGHGIPSALLMASARAAIRQRMAKAGSLVRAAEDINRQLTGDIEETGRFMTLFLVQIDLQTRKMTYLSAGHDPALLYDSNTGEFQEYGSPGIALGILEDFAFTEYEIRLKPGQIVVLGTDGIWEAKNESGEMFNKSRLKKVIEREHDHDAKEIVDEVIASVEAFRGEKAREDDITLALIKVK